MVRYAATSKDSLWIISASSEGGVCGGTLRVIACIDTPEVIERILVYLATRQSGGINDPQRTAAPRVRHATPLRPSLTR